MVLVRKLSKWLNIEGTRSTTHDMCSNHNISQYCCRKDNAGRDNLRRGGRREVWIYITLEPSNRIMTRGPLTSLQVNSMLHNSIKHGNRLHA